jgi:hypothetical protein
MLALSFYVPFNTEYEFSKSSALTLCTAYWCSLSFWSHRIIYSWWGLLTTRVIYRKPEKVNRAWLHTQTKRFVCLFINTSHRWLMINVTYWSLVKITQAWLTHKQSVLHTVTWFLPLPVLDNFYIWSKSIVLVLSGDRWKVEWFLWCVKKCWT